MNPYDNNPFKTDETKDTRSEYDANRALVDSVRETAGKATAAWKIQDDPYNRGYALGVAQALTYVEIDLRAKTSDMTPRLSDLLEV